MAEIKGALTVDTGKGIVASRLTYAQMKQRLVVRKERGAGVLREEV